MVQLAKGGKKQEISDTRYQGTKKEPSVQTSIILPKSLHRELQRQSFETGKSMSVIVIESLRAKFEEE